MRGGSTSAQQAEHASCLEVVCKLFVCVLCLLQQVEMFVLATPEQSDALHEELIQIEKDLFTDLGLHFKVP